MNKETVTITEHEKEVFDYLNELRDSGTTNMFGAGSYVMDQFDVGTKEANTILGKWMENFNADGYEHLTIA